MIPRDIISAYLAMRQILIGTKNPGKIVEICHLISELPFEIVTLDKFPAQPEPEETGASFAENAALKAIYYAKHTGLWALADDSGLEVDALNGAPGIFSARYAGEKATSEQRVAKLLTELKNVDDADRSARFVCAVAIADQTANIQFMAEGACEGKIARYPTGSNGFGYDPVFIPDGYTESFGMLAAEIKHPISHRGRAIAKILAFLRGISVP